MRYQLFIKQSVQLVGYNPDYNNPDYNEINGEQQTVMVAFSGNDKTQVKAIAKALRTLHSKTTIIVYDSNTGARDIIK